MLPSIDGAQRPIVTALGFIIAFDLENHPTRNSEQFKWNEQPLTTKSHLNSPCLITLPLQINAIARAVVSMHSLNTFQAPTNITTWFVYVCVTNWEKKTHNKTVVNYNSWTSNWIVQKIRRSHRHTIAILEMYYYFYCTDLFDLHRSPFVLECAFSKIFHVQLIKRTG